MPLILDRNHVLEIHDYASEKKWVLPAFNSENLTASEAILSGVWEYGQSIGIDDLPIIIGITNNYPERPQAQLYTQTRKWQIGMKMFLDDLKELTSPGSPLERLKVMIHLDHIIWNKDKELLNWDMSQFSSIMFDASDLPLEMNIRKTAEFVKQNGDKVVIEGACDEIGNSGMYDQEELSASEKAVSYFRETGVDILVANLGTEHRASSASLKYNRQLAKEISKQIGAKLCLHGTSSIPKDELSNLYADGIQKVNIWTSLERDSAPELFQKMVDNAAKIAGPEKVKDLIKTQVLGEKSDSSSLPSVDYFTTTFRQDIVFKQMKDIVINYLKIWYK
jgi:fructose/tagatose bisphosphate aldolase